MTPYSKWIGNDTIYHFETLLQECSISVIKDFYNNLENIKRFEDKYCKSTPKIVLCGINPGRHGAGKTGIPFIDFNSLSKLIEGVEQTDSERSAAFFYDVIEAYGSERFFEDFFVTNISPVGFVDRNGNNLNYYDLPEKMKKFVMELFTQEMESIQPTTIVALSQKVHGDLNTLFKNTPIDVSNKLAHPNWCAFPSHRESSIKKYVDLLTQLSAKGAE